MTARTGLRSAALALSLLSLAALGTNAALAQTTDEIGIFFDAAFTQNQLEVTSFPAVVPGYLVLSNPTSTTGVSGWELCAAVDGPAQLLSWTLEGQTINVETPPCFIVGIGGEPLPDGEHILLATFQLLVNGPLPVGLSLGPVYHATLPGEMAYLVGGDPESVLPLNLPADAEGETVAWLNRYTPWYDIDPQSLYLGETYLGGQIVRTITVSNPGGGPLDLDIGLDAGCDDFFLPGISGPATVQPGASLVIEVGFIPSVLGLVECSLHLGGIAPDVPLSGRGREPSIGWLVPPYLDFGEVAVGLSATLPLVIQNSGETDLPIDAFLAPECAVYSVDDPLPFTLPAGTSRTLNVTFAPVADGSAPCVLDLGSVVSSVELRGSGRTPVTAWQVPAALDFGTILVGITEMRELTIVNTGETVLPLAFTLVDGCPEFDLVDGTPGDLAPGSSRVLQVLYTPAAVGPATCTLDLGAVVDPVALSGSGRDAVTSWYCPTELDFQSVYAGQAQTRELLVVNNGELDIPIQTTLPADCAEFSLVAPLDVVLGAGDFVTISVVFAPTEPGDFTCALDLGPIVPPVALIGTGVAPGADWEITPASLLFADTVVGTERWLSVRIENTGALPLELTVVIPDTVGFVTEQDYNPYTLSVPVGGTAYVAVGFRPLADGIVTSELRLGAGIEPVPLAGRGVAATSDCLVSPQSLDFGYVFVGLVGTRTFTVTNLGNVAMTTTPLEACGSFTVTPATARIDPGSSQVFTVTFAPYYDGSFACDIELSPDYCATVQCTGLGGVSGWGWGFDAPDAVGIFFDTAASEAVYNGPAYTPVEAYLTLLNPTAAEGIGGWECRLEIVGNALLLGTTYNGQIINVLEPPSYMVGLGSPLPATQAVLLATLQLIPMAYETVLLNLHPVYQASIPDQMSYLAWGTDELKIMQPIWGNPTVAMMSWEPLVGIGTPTPTARLNGGAVTLSWPAPTGANDGCLVYRRAPGETARRLTAVPLTVAGATFEFVDTPTGFAPGTTLYYSYSVVTDGLETALSSEVEVQLAAGVPMATRLLANVPNPFNPETEIRFQLARAGGVRVAVYDMTGRRVALLLDGHHEAGLGAVTWYGRDDAGRPLPSGAYTVRLETPDRLDHRKVMLLK